jgi:23S rRNA (guanosine2251-2'-O)-methyltransferase
VIVYGRNPVREAILGPRTVSHVWLTKGAARDASFASLRGVAISVTSSEEIEHRCGSSSHQGVCAEVSAFSYADGDAVLGKPGSVLIALDQVQDPQNLGAIARSAECAGALAVVIPERRSVEITPAVCKASAGAVEHIAVARVRNLADFLVQAKDSGFWCYGADASGARRYDEITWSGGVVLVLGAEGTGLRPRVAAACDELVSIPLRGRIESLSVSAAGAVLLYAATAGRARPRS